MKTVTDAYKAAQAEPIAKVARRISYKRRSWDAGTSSYIWETSWTVLPEASVISVGAVTAKLDTDRLNEFKISNVDLAILNDGGMWSPWGGSTFTGYEPFWTKFKIESGWILSDGTTEYATLFVGVAVGFTLKAGDDTVRFQVQGLEAILQNADAENVSTTVADETPSGTVNGTNVDFTTLNPGVGIIDEVAIDGTAKKVGTDFDISQLNEPTLGAKITFATAPVTGQAVTVSYRYWKQDQKIEDLVLDLLEVADMDTGANIQAVSFPGGVSDSFTFDALADWTAGSGADVDLTRYPGDVRIAFDAATNYDVLDTFTDGDYTASPTWTTSGTATFAVVSGRLKLATSLVSQMGTISLPPNGSKVGMWAFKFQQSSTFEGRFHFPIASNAGTDGDYDGDYIVVACSGGTYGDGHTRVRLYEHNYFRAEYDVTSMLTLGVDMQIKVTRGSDKTIRVYADGTLIITYTSLYTGWTDSNHTGFAVGLSGSTGQEWLVDDPTRPKDTLSGTWTSQTLDMTASVVSFGTMVIEKHDGAGAVTISTRTSADGLAWDAWAAVSPDGTVNSTARRYVQIKVELSMDSSDTDEPYVSYLKLNYNKLTTLIKLANFTGKTVYDAIQSLGAFANYEWGFIEDETFFFREKTVDVSIDQALDWGTNLLDFETVNAGHDRVYSEVQATFGEYDVVVKDESGETGPLKRFGRKRLTVDGGDLLISPDTNVATGIATGMLEVMKVLRRVFRARVKLMQWLDLSDTVEVTYLDQIPAAAWYWGDTTVYWGDTTIYYYGGSEQAAPGILCKVIGCRHDLESGITDLDLEEIIS